MKRFAILFALLCLLSAGALAEPRAYTFGGSGTDSVQAIAASADGRIVLTGYTNSTDGTLATRTKTGHSGWALCVDAQGNVLWSFCSRLGTADRMDRPVFHEDGCVTVVLCADKGEGDEYELIRLDRNGEVVSRKTMLTGEGIWSVHSPNVTDGGYILCRYEKDGFTPQRFSLFDFDGDLVRELNGWEAGGEYMVLKCAGRHVLRSIVGGALLTAFDAQGYESILAEPRDVMPNPDGYAIYLKLISLPDGGAVGAGRMDAASTESGRLTKWDAQGETVFDWWIQAGALLDLVHTENGFAALMAPYERTARQGWFDWSLVCYDEDGIQTGIVPLPETDIYSGALAALPDGSVAVAQIIEDAQGGYDTRLVIVPKEDMP